MKNVAVLIGSLSGKSINRTLAKVLEKLGEGRLRFDYLQRRSVGQSARRRARHEAAHHRR
jgi:hypothetical protein